MAELCAMCLCKISERPDMIDRIIVIITAICAAIGLIATWLNPPL